MRPAPVPAGAPVGGRGRDRAAGGYFGVLLASRPNFGGGRAVPDPRHPAGLGQIRAIGHPPENPVEHPPLHPLENSPLPGIFHQTPKRVGQDGAGSHPSIPTEMKPILGAQGTAPRQFPQALVKGRSFR